MKNSFYIFEHRKKKDEPHDETLYFHYFVYIVRIFNYLQLYERES